MNIQEIILKRKTLADSLLTQLKMERTLDYLLKIFIRDWSSKIMAKWVSPKSQNTACSKILCRKSEIGKLIGPLQIENYYGIFKILGRNLAR